MIPSKSTAKPSPAQKLRSILTNSGSLSAPAPTVGGATTNASSVTASSALPGTGQNPTHPPSSTLSTPSKRGPSTSDRQAAHGAKSRSSGDDTDGYATPNDQSNAAAAAAAAAAGGHGETSAANQGLVVRSVSLSRRRRQQSGGKTRSAPDFSSPLSSSKRLTVSQDQGSPPPSPVAPYQDVLVSDEEDFVFEDDYEGDREDEPTPAFDRTWDLAGKRKTTPGIALRGRHRRSRSSAGQVPGPTANDEEADGAGATDPSLQRTGSHHRAPVGSVGGGGGGGGVGPPLIRYIRSWGANKLEGLGAMVPDITTSRSDSAAAIPAAAATAPSDTACRSGQHRFYDALEEADDFDAGFVGDDDDGVVSESGLLVHDDENDSSLSGGTEAGDESDDDESSWSFSAACEGPRDWDFDTEWSEMPPLPHRFCLATGRASALPYLDAPMLHEKTQLLEREADRFALEQGLYLQAVMQLLAERDQVGVEGSIHSGENILKKGPLKKLSTAVIGGARMNKWKNKYVELRQGNMCYYEDSGPGRKTIHIRRSDTTVQPTYLSRSAGHTDYVFELCVQGSPTRYWMARSEEDRQAWIKAIEAATLLGSDGPEKVLDLAPHQPAVEAFAMIRERVQSASSKEEYLDAILHADYFGATVADDALRVPVAWILEQIQKNESEKAGCRHRKSLQLASVQKQIKSSISDFWARMGRTTFSINGITLPCESPRAPARVMGALTRAILEYDKAFVAARDATPVLFAGEGEDAEKETPPVHADAGGRITELQAASYSRDILMAVLRNEESQPASVTVQFLLQKVGLASPTRPTGDEHLVSVDVSFPGEELPDEFLPPVSDEVAGWVRIRRPKQPAKSGRRRYAVLSGSVLSYYEHANPRPTGLRGQLLLNGASLKTRSDDIEADGTFEFTVSTSQEHDRVLTFDTELDFLDWKEAIQAVIESCASCKAITEVPAAIPEEDDCDGKPIDGDPAMAAPVDDVAPRPSHTASRSVPGSSIRRNAERVAQGVTERVIKGADGSIRGGIRVIKGAKDGGIKVIKTATDGSMKVLRGAVGRLPTDSSMKVIRGAVGRLRPARGTNESISGDRRRSLSRRPSMQVLLNNTELSGKRDEPTVQCVVQSTHTFHVGPSSSIDSSTGAVQHDPPSAPHEEPWLSVNVRLYQAFLLMGGLSGRMAHGDALIELDFLDSSTIEALEF